MSVLQRKELEDSPLADLHAIASELGIEGYRALRREDLVGAILRAQGGEESDAASSSKVVAPAADTGFEDVEPEPEQEPELPAARLPVGFEPHPDALPFTDSEPDLDAEAAVQPAAEAEPDPYSAAPGDTASDDPADGDTAPDDALDGATAPDDLLDGDTASDGPADGDTASDGPADGDLATGTLDILPNGSGFLRVDGNGQSNDDVYVSPAQIRRCELRAGDEVSGLVRPPRRSERHPSLVRVSTVNDRDAEPPEERPEFADLTPVHPSERLPAPAALDAVPFGKGSRVAITGGPGAGATRLLREVARALAGEEAPLTVVLVGARPEEVTEWKREEGVTVAGGSFDRPLETQIQAAELAVERAKRVVERGGDAVVIVDSFEAIPPGPARRLFGAARKVEEGGSLTVIAAVGGALEPLRQASARVTLDDAAEEPTVLEALSGTQRADVLG